MTVIILTLTSVVRAKELLCMNVIEASVNVIQ